MSTYPTYRTGDQPQGLHWLFSSTAVCVGLLLLAWGFTQISVIRIFEGEYLQFYRAHIENFFQYGIKHVEGWFAFFVIFGPPVAAIVVLLGQAMTSKARAGVVFLGAMCPWGWIAHFLVHLDWYEGSDWFGEGLKTMFANETDTWGSVGCWIYLALLVVSLVHILMPTSATPPMNRASA